MLVVILQAAHFTVSTTKLRMSFIGQEDKSCGSWEQ